MSSSNDLIRIVDLTKITKASFSHHAVGCLILTQNNQILLQHRPDNWRRFPGCLATFGGGIETGESPMEALVRELHEELGAIVQPSDVISLGAVTEAVTEYGDLIYEYFWHDKTGTITGCYECESRFYDSIDEVLTHPKVMDDVCWLLDICRSRGLVK
jgi:8-oxo-dGTP diphosphatase